MSKKYIAIVDNIYFNERIYGIDDTVIVDDKVQMNPTRWQLFEDYLKEQEELAKVASAELADTEKDERIKTLAADNKAKEKEIKELKAKLEAISKDNK